MSHKIVHLHIGTHKTGSTSIQKYLANYSIFFENHGFHVARDWDPMIDGGPAADSGCNCFRIANTLIRNDLHTPMRLRANCRILDDRSRVIAIGRVNRYLSNLTSDHIVVSAEALSFLREPQERIWLDLMFKGLMVRPIGFFRNPGDWLRSRSAQLHRNALIKYPAATPGRGIFDVSDASWMVVHEDIKGFFGDHGRYLSYDNELRNHGSVLPGFLAFLGLDPKNCPPWWNFYYRKTPYPID